MRRTVVIIAWVIVACVAWIAACMGSLKALQRFDPSALQSMVKAVPDVVFLGGILIVGPLVAMALVGYLGLRGKLPGTRVGQRQLPSAFPVVPTPRPGDVG